MSGSMTGSILTVGHSTHPLPRFVSLLQQHGISAVCDVRSRPYSRVNPQYNRDILKRALGEHGILYVFLGAELGARSDDPSCYVRGKVQYDRLAQTALFKRGINRLCKGMETYNLILMCAEREPLECHRTILISRHLVAAGIEVKHVIGDGTIESHDQTLNRLLRQLQLSKHHSYCTREEMTEAAYRIQGDKIAYRLGSATAADIQLTMGEL
jgi:uncharacterized protein (DUF488 family)